MNVYSCDKQRAVNTAGVKRHRQNVEHTFTTTVNAYIVASLQTNAVYLRQRTQK